MAENVWAARIHTLNDTLTAERANWRTKEQHYEAALREKAMQLHGLRFEVDELVTALTQLHVPVSVAAPVGTAATAHHTLATASSGHHHTGHPAPTGSTTPAVPLQGQAHSKDRVTAPAGRPGTAPSTHAASAVTSPVLRQSTTLPPAGVPGVPSSLPAASIHIGSHVLQHSGHGALNHRVAFAPIATATSLPAPAVTTATPLPPGWVEHFDPSSQRHFYVKEATHESTWTRPVVVPPAPPPRRTAPVASIPALPLGWEEHVDPTTQRHFYVNEKTHESTWARPVAAANTTAVIGHKSAVSATRTSDRQ